MAVSDVCESNVNLATRTVGYVREDVGSLLFTLRGRVHEELQYSMFELTAFGDGIFEFGIEALKDVVAH